MSLTQSVNMFDEMDAEKQKEIDRWVFDRLPLTREQKSKFLQSLAPQEEEKKGEACSCCEQTK